MNGDLLHLHHIRECIDLIRSYIADDELFAASPKTVDAVLRRLQTLAESTQQLSEAFKDAHSEIDWAAIGRFGNVIVHDYLGIDPDQIRSIIDHDLPLLFALVQDALPD